MADVIIHDIEKIGNITDVNKLQKVFEFMPEIKRGVCNVGKFDSQTTTSLMTLNMIDAGPYRVLKQILSQIDAKMSALRENVYKILKLQIRLTELESISDKSKLEVLEISEIISNIDHSKPYINSAVREIGALQDRYKEVVNNHNIPENWTEEDFEEAEIEHHIKCIFRNAIRDRMAGCCNMGTMEYMEQYGIEPVYAYTLVDNFLIALRQGLSENLEPPSIEIRYQFYDDMYNRFKNEYKKAIKRIGINSIHYPDWLIKEEGA